MWLAEQAIYKAKKRLKKGKKTLHFKAPKVHDFAWVADPDFIHDTVQVPEVVRF